MVSQQRPYVLVEMGPVKMGQALFLLDEPFAELDNQTREITAGWVADMARSNNKTLILVTHQQEDFEKLATQNWLL